MCGEVLSLPVHPGVSEADVATVVAEVRAFYG
jgi:dTDP-4-amino-4,6-dideoxygalactose transaminase